MTGAGDEGFLARWSRRKRALGEEAAHEDPLPEQPPQAEAPPAEFAPPGQTPRLPGQVCPIPNLPEIDLASLPRIEDLTVESDFGLFLRPGVPTVLRNAALRRMWSLDPAIRDFIGPVDYQWDFNAAGGLPPGFSSELGGDVARLLAQAIGHLEQTDVPGNPPTEPATVPLEPSVAPPPQATMLSEAATEDPPAPAEVVVQAPRRHGRALPT